jgi:inhibitor of cysteine peptidase
MGTSTHIYVSVNNIYLTYLTRMSWVEKMERRIEEIVIPIVPTEISKEINGVRNSDLSRTEKLKEIDEIVGYYTDSLTEEEKTNLSELYQAKETEFEQNIQRDIEKTTIHRIFIRSGNIKYMASGGVPGYVLKNSDHNRPCFENGGKCCMQPCLRP